MISHTDKLRGGPLAETEIYVAPATDEDLALSRLNQNFRLSKAQQILRLLKDQDDLNQRFRDCALLDDDAGAEGDRERRARRQREGDDEDRWSVEEEQLSDGGESDTSENEAERRAARRVALRKHRNSIDPGRCKTSMGFHNQAEVTDVPYDTDSDNVAGLDSACSTPRGGPGGPLSARQPASHSLYGPVMVGRGNTSVSSSNNARLRAFHLKIGDGDARNGDLSDECVVQSARSARPKTSLTSMATSSNSSSSSRHRYYRQQPHPESHYKSSPRGHNHHHGQHYHNHHHQNHQLHQQSRSVGETRQAIISRLDPHHPMAVRPFCETKTHAMEEVGTRAGAGAGQCSSQPSTPRGGTRGQGSVPSFTHTEVKLFDMAPSLTRDTASRSSSRRSVGSTGAQGTGLVRSSSFTEHQHLVMQGTGRNLLSVDSSSLPLAELTSPRPGMGDGPGTPRRSKPTGRVKKRATGEMPMHMLADRSHNAMTVMKLPPLEASVSKGGSGRDLVCVGKN